jgi:hypothetical protein
LDSSPAARQLWQFVVDRSEVKPGRVETLPPGEAPPKIAQLVQKDWHDLYQPKLNIAWLPAEQVFLRVVQMPAVDRAELHSMLEFQLEKLSPLALAQVLWNFETLPSQTEKMQTAIVCIVSRDVVEQHLGATEAQGFQPDRLEVPQLNQILADGVRSDGAWIYPGSGPDADICTVAWWASGTLQQLQILRLPGASEAVSAADLSASRARFLEEQLMQTAWAGEWEGWLTLPVSWRLVAEPEVAAAWEPLLSAWTGEKIEPSPALSREALARHAASRAARLEPTANLLPPDFAARYRQQYIDRLWMRGLGALVAIYMMGVAVYLVSLQVYSFRQTQVQARVADIAGTYTNVLQLKERVQVLQEQLSLKYAALDCWKVAAEALPEEFNLTWLMFSRGQTLELHGTAPPGQEQKVTDFNETLRRATVNGEALFRDVAPPNMNSRPGSPNITWNFQCQLNLREPTQ